MSLPVMNVAIDFENNGSWTDVSAYFKTASIKRGSSRVESPIIRYEPGTCELTLNNEDRRFDPTNTDGPYTIPGSGSGSGIQQAQSTDVMTYGYGVTIAVQSTDPTVIAASLRDSNVTASASTSYTVTKPTGTASGDIMVAIQSGDWGAATSMGDPTGGSSWGSAIISQTQGTNTLHVKAWIKTAGGSEPASYGFTQASSSDGVAMVFCIRDAALAHVEDYEINNATAFFSTPSITPGGDADFEIRYAAGTGGGSSVTWDWSGTSDPTGTPYVEREDAQSTDFTTASAATASLEGLVTGTGGTLVKPMRPVRVRAIWDEPGTGTNMVDNPSFETNTTGWSTGANTTIARVNTVTAPLGSWELSITRTATNPPFSLYLATADGLTGTSGTSGKRILVSAKVYIPAASYSHVTSLAISATGIASTFIGKPSAADTWEQMDFAVTLTADVASVAWQFWTDDGHTDGQVVGYLDDVHVEISEHDLFRGYVDSWNIAWNGPNWSEVTVPCTDAFKIFGNIERTAVAAVGAGEGIGTRIGRILDGIGWSSSLREIDTGDVTAQSTTLDGNALEEMLIATETEVGEFYMTGDGKVFFRDRSGITDDTRSTTSQATFGDDPAELRYKEVTLSNDDTQLYNRIIATRVGGSVQTANDTASQDEFLLRSYERSDLIMQTDGAALNYAQYVLSLSAQPELRFEQMVIQPQRDETNLFPQAFNRLIGDRITVRRRPPGGGTLIEEDSFIRGIKHDITPGDWATTWTLQSSAAAGSFFIIGNATLGRLDRNPLGF